MKQKHQLTKDVKIKLRRIAKKMPPMLHKKRTKKIIKTGSEISKDIPDAKDENGKPLLPGKYYETRVPLDVNHEKEMEQIYIDFGWDGVSNYINETMQMHKEINIKMNVQPLNKNENEK